jgi:hypothetical protein
MDQHSPPPRRLLGIALTLAGAGALPAAALAQATLRPPNLTPFPASNVSLVTNSIAGTTTLRLATTSWNNGAGPLELVAGPIDTGSGKQQVFQRIATDGGGTILHEAGWFQYHDEHSHIHYDDYALYTLQPVDASGGSLLTGQKVTFCVMDTTKIDTRLPGAPATAVYTTCGNQVQGMSIGWGDTYGAHLPGQEIDVTDAPSGIYQLRIEIDPTGDLIETDEEDNESCALLSIQRPSTVTVLDTSGSCSAVAYVTPSSARMGTSVQVTIAGYGFAEGLNVSFERGNGPRPVATNIVLASDTATLDMITATITVPAKRQLGKDPVWDLRVGNGGVLRDAFTVTR